MKMKQIEQGSSLLPPPPPPPLPRFWANKAVTESVTKREIARFWYRKRIEEEEHLLAAIKAAARIRARKLSVRFYLNHHVTHTIELRHDQKHVQKSSQ